MDTRLQYECMSLVSTKDENDGISCFRVSEKLLAIGRESGRLDLLDYNGDVIKRFHEHSGSIRDICFDGRSSEYLASCSDDGSAVIYSLYDGCHLKHVVESGNCRLSAVALDPRCSTRKTKELVVGDERGRVYFLSSGWLGQSETVLFSGKYRIDTIIWSGTLVGWASLSGVRLYDMRSHSPMGMIMVDGGKGGDCITMLRCINQSDMHSSANIGIESNRYDLFLGSASAVYHVEFPSGNSLASTRGKQLEASQVFKTSRHDIHSFVVNISDYPDYKITVLTCRDIVYSVLLVDTMSLSVQNIVSGDVPVFSENARLYLSENPADRLDSGDPLFFIQTCRTVTMAKSLDVVTRLGCLCQAGQYEDAIHLIETNKELEIYKNDLIEKYMVHIMEEDCSEKAGVLAATLLGDDYCAWERWATTLARAKKVHHIAAHIPFQNPDGKMISKATYDMVIKSCFQQRKYETTKKLVEMWPINLYGALSVLAMANERLASDPEHSNILSNIVTIMYTKLGMHQRVIEVFISQADQTVFDYIREHKQYVGFHLPTLAMSLMEMDEQKATALLVDNFDVAPPLDVVLAIFHADELDGELITLEMRVGEMTDTWATRLYGYLCLLHKKDPSISTFDTILVELCAKIEPKNIMNLLQSLNSYKLDVALKSCEEHNLIDGQVFVLGRMGLMIDALNIIIHKIRDVSAAVSFARDTMDSALWDELYQLANRNQDLVSELLEFSGDGIDTGKLLESISPGTNIPHLKQKLVEASRRMQQDAAVQSCCLFNAQSDCSMLLHQLYKQISTSLEVVLWRNEEDSPILCYNSQL